MALSTERGSPLLITIAVLVVGSVLGTGTSLVVVELAPLLFETEPIQSAFEMSFVLGLLPVDVVTLLTYSTATIAALCAFWAFAHSMDMYLTQN